MEIGIFVVYSIVWIAQNVSIYTSRFRHLALQVSYDAVLLVLPQFTSTIEGTVGAASKVSLRALNLQNPQQYCIM